MELCSTQSLISDTLIAFLGYQKPIKLITFLFPDRYPTSSRQTSNNRLKFDEVFLLLPQPRPPPPTSYPQI